MNPYVDLPVTAFWKTAIAQKNLLAIDQLWQPKIEIPARKPIVTAGSCFAQHIGKALARNGFNWHDAEPAPRGMSDEMARKFNYGIFSFRTGNIYTTSLLRQWVEWAFGVQPVPDEVWQDGDRFYDPWRPVVEPNGFASAEEVRVSRQGTVDAVKRALTKASVFVFTLGLTESWKNKETGLHYPMCPGTAAGTFDADKHVFENLKHRDIFSDLITALHLIRKHNSSIRILLTVSPVPLTATASGQHVLTATTFSKSTLRSVAGEVAARGQWIDYFPSYEIITAPAFRGTFFAPNMREVAPEGVAFVMKSFFACLGIDTSETAKPATDEDGGGKRRQDRAGKNARGRDADDPRADPSIECEEELLAAFGR